MSENRKNITKEDFQQYLGNQMTDAERNAFERELQKYPFEAEALEGMQQFSPDDIQSDINRLSEKISSKSKRKNSRFWAVAATILLLVSVGVIWFQIKDKSLTPEMAQTKSVQEQKEEPGSKTLSGEIQEENQPVVQQKEKTPPATDDGIKQPEMFADRISEKNEGTVMEQTKAEQNENYPEQNEDQIREQEMFVANKITESEIENAAPIQSRSVNPGSKTITPNQIAQTAKASRVNDVNENIVEGQVISLGDSMPLPGASIVEKGTSNATVSDMNGNFALKLKSEDKNPVVASYIGMENTEFLPTDDSMIVVGLEPSQVAMEEVVVTGYGSQKKNPLTKSISASENHEVQPKVGMEKFKEYIKENAVLPDDYALNRVAVRAQIKINTQGKIVSVENMNNAESQWFDRTKNLLVNGPEWNPKTINGTPVESEFIIRIVFKK